MPSTRGEALVAIDKILADNDAVIGVALNVTSGVGEGAVTGIMNAGDTLAAAIAENTGLDTAVITSTDEGGIGEERALEAARAARDAFLSLPSSIRAMTERALADISADTGTEQDS